MRSRSRSLRSVRAAQWRGPGAAAWLAAHGALLPDRVGCALRQPDGALAVRLAPASFIVLEPSRGRRALRGARSPPTRSSVRTTCFDLPVRDSLGWVALAGAEAAESLARFCSLDLRERSFPDGAAAQTHVAKLSATLVRADERGAPVFHLLTDAASAEWLRGVLGGGRSVVRHRGPLPQGSGARPRSSAALVTRMLVGMSDRGPDSAGIAIYRRAAPPGTREAHARPRRTRLRVARAREAARRGALGRRSRSRCAPPTRC